MSTAPDRLETLKDQNVLTGIDFVYVAASQQVLEVHFHVQPSTLTSSLVGGVSVADVRIYDPLGEVPDVVVVSAVWVGEVLRLSVPSGGDFTRYRLHIDDLRIDDFYNDMPFSFKANCPSDLDCAPDPHDCPDEADVDVAIDYSARDFWSYRQALLDFAAQRYPDWADRLEADGGIMLAEVMSALADEMAYYQDRISREAYLETASQRRSLRRHARLVDYHIHDGSGARVWLDVGVQSGSAGLLPSGSDVWQAGENGRVYFEIGEGLRDVKNYRVDAARNEFLPHAWDEDDVCLPVGATELAIVGHHAATILEDAGVPISSRMMLLVTRPTDPAQAERRHFVRVVAAENDRDKVFGVNITRLRWEVAQATPFEMDLTCLVLRGNIVPATSGHTETAYCLIDAPLSSLTPSQLLPLQGQILAQSVGRVGANGSTHLFSLAGSENVSVVHFGDNLSAAIPEVQVIEQTFNGANWLDDEVWAWQHSMLGLQSSRPESKDFTLDDGTWRRVVGYQRAGSEFVHYDYAANEGRTIRFGDGEFGFIPPKNTLFKVRYRVGGGRRSNVAADTLTSFEGLPFIKSITNPLPAYGGFDAQTAAEVRQEAPEAFRAVTYRAVRPEDYAEAAERLDWVQKAGAAFRWTGSWLTAFVTPDPKGASVLAAPQRTELERQINRFRQAGREAHVLDPDYADLDLEMEVCVAPNAYRGDVKARVLEALLGKNGYFSPDRFTFGQALERSTLEAAIQVVPGVRAVEQIRFRRRGWFEWRNFGDLCYYPGQNVIIRVENDPLHPDRGSLKIGTHGGA